MLRHSQFASKAQFARKSAVKGKARIENRRVTMTERSNDAVMDCKTLRKVGAQPHSASAILLPYMTCKSGPHFATTFIP